jgi:hypothetical protein
LEILTGEPDGYVDPKKTRGAAGEWPLPPEWMDDEIVRRELAQEHKGEVVKGSGTPKYTFYPRNEKVIEEERKLYWGKDLYPDRSEEMHRDYVRRTEEE